MVAERSKEPTVLLVDDDTMIRGYLRIIMRDQGFNVVGEAGNVEEARRLVRKLKPMLVFLDINLPGGSGLGALRSMQGDSPETKFIMLSGESTTDNVKTAIKEGACGFVAKPFNTEAVLQSIQRVAKRL